jgi:hypothetical protein
MDGEDVACSTYTFTKVIVVWEQLNENRASHHEDGQRAEASPDPPLSEEKTEREH